MKKSKINKIVIFTQPAKEGNLYTSTFPKSEIKFSKRSKIPEWGNKITIKVYLSCPPII
jgi:predicted 3-demethylubiquinone-9 3-methyltransferase (glyoxalase superfamily)